MPKAEKVEKVEDLKQRIEGSSALLLADFRGLSVQDAGELREQLREADARFMVVKNTLLKRAADEEGMEDLAQLLQGPTGVAFVSGDAVAAAKKITEAAKKFPALVLKGGWMDGRLLTADDAEELSKLESREAMLSKIAGLMKGEMSRAANMFVSLQSQFLSLLEAYKEKLPGEDAAEAAAVESAEAPSAEPQEASATEAPADTTTEAPAEAPAEEVEAPAAEAAADAGAEAGPEAGQEPGEQDAEPEVASEEASAGAPDASDESSTDEAQASGEGEE